MNITQQTMQGIKDQYYWIDERTGLTLGSKNVVHGIIIYIAVIIIICILLWYRSVKKDGTESDVA